MPFALAPVALAAVVVAAPAIKGVSMTNIDPVNKRVTQVTYDGVQTYYPIRVCYMQPQYYTEQGTPVGMREVCDPY